MKESEGWFTLAERLGDWNDNYYTQPFICICISRSMNFPYSKDKWNMIPDVPFTTLVAMKYRIDTLLEGANLAWPEENRNTHEDAQDNINKRITFCLFMSIICEEEGC